MKCWGFGKYGVYPSDSYSAYTNGCQNCRNKRNSKYTKIAGHYLIKYIEAVRNKNNNKTLISNCNDLGIPVKKGEQKSATTKDKKNYTFDRKQPVAFF